MTVETIKKHLTTYEAVFLLSRRKIKQPEDKVIHDHRQELTEFLHHFVPLAKKYLYHRSCIPQTLGMWEEDFPEIKQLEKLEIVIKQTLSNCPECLFKNKRKKKSHGSI